MDRLGFGIVGLGNITVGTIAPAMLELAECELIAGTSRDQGRADAFAERFGARRAYDDYDAMLADPDVQAVYIATPNALHGQQTVAAARAGKHVWCDKPLALSRAEAVRSIVACRDAGVALGVNFHNRHLPWLHEVTRLIADGHLGDVEVIHIEASSGPRHYTNWRADPALAGLGTLSNVGGHPLDWLGVILDSRAVEVSAMLDPAPGSGQVEMLAMVLLRFANGTRVFCNFNERVRDPLNDVVIYGTRGRIIGKNLTRSRLDGELHVRTEEGETVTPYPNPKAHQRSLRAFARAVLAGEEPNASGQDGLRSVVLTEAIARAAAERRTVDVPDVD